jgi:hypothetical protein
VALPVVGSHYPFRGWLSIWFSSLDEGIDLWEHGPVNWASAIIVP